MSLFDDSIPANSEAVRLGAQRIRELKTTLNTLLGEIFSAADGTFITGWIQTAMIDALQVTAAKLATNSVTITKLPDGVFTADATGRAKFAPGFLTPPLVTWSPGALATSGTIASVDCSTGLTFASTLTDNLTITAISNLQDGQSVIFAITQFSGGSKTITFPAAIKWHGGIAPVLTTTASHTDLFSVTKVGSTLYGNFSQNYF